MTDDTARRERAEKYLNGDKPISIEDSLWARGLAGKFAAGVAIPFVAIIIALALEFWLGSPDPTRAGGVELIFPGGRAVKVQEIVTESGTRCVLAGSQSGDVSLSCDWSKP